MFDFLIVSLFPLFFACFISPVADDVSFLYLAWFKDPVGEEHYLLTPSSRVWLEKLIVVQLVYIFTHVLQTEGSLLGS